jgi:hypothetical protein
MHWTLLINARLGATAVALLAPTIIIVALSAGRAAADEEQACRSLDAVEWLLGAWTRTGKTSVTRETWRRVSEATYEGESIATSLADGEVLNYETLRLVSMSDGVFYIAKVTENDLPVPFRMTRCADDLAVFENPGHEAPQRLSYKRKHAQGTNHDALDVTVEGGAMKAFTVHFTRSAPEWRRPGG